MQPLPEALAEAVALRRAVDQAAAHLATVTAAAEPSGSIAAAAAEPSGSVEAFGAGSSRVARALAEARGAVDRAQATATAARAELESLCRYLGEPPGLPPSKWIELLRALAAFGDAFAGALRQARGATGTPRPQSGASSATPPRAAGSRAASASSQPGAIGNRAPAPASSATAHSQVKVALASELSAALAARRSLPVP